MKMGAMWRGECNYDDDLCTTADTELTDGYFSFCLCVQLGIDAVAVECVWHDG